MATKKTQGESTRIEIPELQLQVFTLKIIGDTPLITHAWSQKAKNEILQKQMKEATVGKETRRPQVEFADSLYWLTDKPDLDGLTNEQAEELLGRVIPQSKFGFPAIAFKACALGAGFQQGALVRNSGTSDLAKTTARGALHIIGNECVVIEGTPTIREDSVRIGGTKKTSNLAYRAEFKSWRTELLIQFNTRTISAAQIVNLFRLGGFANGVGEWRPERGGTFGRFHIE